MNTRRPGKYLLLCGLLWLAGCGNTGSNGTGSPMPMAMVASGPVTSLGPLGVAGTHLDDAGTQVLLNSTASRQAADLRLGMFADADGMVTPSTADGSAATAVAQSVALGPVTSIDAGNRRVHVMGLPARADRNTLLEGIESLERLALGDWVEVFGLRLPGDEGFLATRLIAHGAPQDLAVEVLGTVTDFSAGTIVATPGLRIELANAQVATASPAGVQLLPPGAAGLTPGAAVRIRGSYDRASGTVTATSVTTGFAPTRPEGRLVYLDAFVLARTSTLFQVGDLYVDTTQIATPLAVGTRVRLRGHMTSGAVRVDEVVEIAPEAQIEYVVEGLVSAFGSLSDFMVRGERIDASQAVFSGGDASSLGQGRRVRVKGVAGPGRINATEVEILG
jgi:hypothetical protein